MSLPSLIASLPSPGLLHISSLIEFLVLGIVYYFVLYPLFFSPLSRVPGPKLAALSSYYLNRRYLREDGVCFIENLHRKYGPIVRIGPNEVDINDPKELPTIYGIHSDFPKPPSTILFENYSHPCTFSSITRVEHRNRRRQVAKIYTMTSLQNNAGIMEWIEEAASKILNKLDSQFGKTVDIYALGASYALDIVSYMVYGESLDLLGGNNLQASDNIRIAVKSTIPLTRFFELTKLMPIFPFSLFVPDFLKRASKHRESFEAINLKYVAQVTTSKKQYNPEKCTAACLAAQPEFGSTIQELHVASECIDHVAAGADSTAATIAYLFYTLAQPQNIKYQTKIHEEVSKLSLPYSHKEICNLPYLNTVILEIQRVYPAGPGSVQQRMTPAGQNTILSFRGETYSLPPNTQVCIQPYSLHRNVEVFGIDVEIFRPERWQEVDDEQLQRMRDAWIPFGRGARTCLGMNLALMEIKYLAATILRDHVAELPLANEKVNDMTVQWGAVIRPRAEKCQLTFRKI